MIVKALAELTDIERAALLDRQGAVPAAIRARAAKIVEDVARGGDEALRKWTRDLDGCDMGDPFVPGDDIDAALARVPDALLEALRRDHARIQAFHLLQRPSGQTIETAPGLRLGRRAAPLRRAACYVPGGRAAYPSTVLMTVVPAVIAGVEDVVVVTPPGPDGSVPDVVLAAARIAGATHVLRAGGAQAVAAVAFGTERVPRCDVLVGPGNAYVTAAKQIVADRIRVDAPAGPSELLVLADDSADADHVALDLMAQAEHDPDAHVVLVTTDAALPAWVKKRIDARLPDAPRGDVIRASLDDHGFLLTATDRDAAIAFSNDHAPEHLAIMTRDPHAVLDRVTAAGSVFLGPMTPVSLGDYGSGTNHVLPTMGHARRQGGLCVDDFQTWITWQEATAEGLAAVADDVAVVARAEGLHAHADAVEQRLGPRGPGQEERDGGEA